MTLVKVQNLNFEYFGTKILHDINLEVNENDRLLLVGSNGAGKSTLLRVLSGTHLARDNKIFNVLGSVTPQDQCNGLAYLGNRWVRNISFVGQSAYTADIRAGDMMKRWQDNNLERRNELVDVLEINLDWRMHQVSDGQRKKVQIMLALLKPFNYINKELNMRNGALIYATHIFDNLEKWMNKVVYISNGVCEDKVNMNEFNDQNNLYDSVKNKLLNDKNRCIEGINITDPTKFGPQYGYSSGRLSNIL
jgi:CCR4-NOT complex subunit CAF16